MNTNNSLAAFWRSYSSAGRADKLLGGKAAALSPDPVTDAGPAFDLLDHALLAAVDRH